MHVTDDSLDIPINLTDSPFPCKGSFRNRNAYIGWTLYHIKQAISTLRNLYLQVFHNSTVFLSSNWLYTRFCHVWNVNMHPSFWDLLGRKKDPFILNIFIILDITANQHDDVIKRKHFPRYWPFVRGIHRSPVNSPHKGLWHGALMLSLICAWINGWVNNCRAGDLRRYRAHYDVIVMSDPGHK